MKVRGYWYEGTRDEGIEVRGTRVLRYEGIEVRGTRVLRYEGRGY